MPINVVDANNRGVWKEMFSEQVRRELFPVAQSVAAWPLESRAGAWQGTGVKQT